MDQSHTGNKPHVLLLVYFFPPMESAGFSIRTVKLLKYLCPEGWRFTLITGHPQHPICDLVAHSSHYLMDEIPKDVEVIRVPAPVRVTSRDTGIGRVWNRFITPVADWSWIKSSYRAFEKAVEQHPIDLILVTGPPFITSMLGKKAKDTLGVPLILEFRDDWIDTPFFFQQPGWYRFWKRRLERRLMAAADRVITVTESSLCHFQSRYPGYRAKFHYIPNGWAPDDVPPPLDEGRQRDQFIISAAGGYRREDRSPELFFQAVGRLVGRRPDIRRKIRIELFGNWLYRDFSENDLKRFGVADLVSESPSLSRVELMRRLQASELLLTITSTRQKRSIPGKLYEYWAIGHAPILMIDDPGNAPAEFMNKYGLGTVVAPWDSAGMEKAIEGYYDAWVAGMPVRIPLDGLDQFNRQSLALEMGDVMLSAMNPR